MEQTILCIDDNTDTCELITLVFEQSGYEIQSCADPLRGLSLIKEERFAAVILDFWLGAGISGPVLCRQIRLLDQKIPIIFFTAEAREKERKAALEAGAQAYIVKPSSFEELKNTVVQLIKNEADHESLRMKQKSS